MSAGLKVSNTETEGGHKKLRKLINTKLVFGGGSDISLSAG